MILLFLCLTIFVIRLCSGSGLDGSECQARLKSVEAVPTQPLIFQLQHIVQHDISFGPAHLHYQRDAFHIVNINETIETQGSLPMRPAKIKLRSKGVASDSKSNKLQLTSGFTHLSKPDRASSNVPNTTDKETIVNLAKMTSDAYLFGPGEAGWFNTSLGFNFTDRFGWDDDGLRAHVFTSEDNSTVIVAYKGTSIDPRDKLSGPDRINDVKLFSCCCGAQNPYRYAPVCNCSTGYYTCDSSCVSSSVLQNDTYYNAAVVIMQKMKQEYPHATFWTTGHSLGGSLASLIGLTFDVPAVTFEAPPERLAAERMGLIHAKNPVAYHFGHTADPIYMGACNGYFSTCSLLRFSFESQCFTGKRCQYETVRDKGWRVNIANHRINYVIENVLKAYETVPECGNDEDDDCQDCFNWKFS